MDTLHLRRIDELRNMARFYILSIEPTLFGGTSLVREWGRIGTSGQRRVDLFECEEEALNARSKLLRQKSRRGYLSH